MILFNPYYIFNVGFILSFLSVFGIGIFYKPVFSKIKIKNNYIRSSLAVYFSCHITLLPALMYFMNQISLISVVANFIVIPLVSLALIVGIAGIFLSGISGIVLEIAAAITLIIESLLELLTTKVPGFFYIHSPLIFMLFIFYLAVFWIAFLNVKRIGFIVYLLVCLLIFNPMYFDNSEYMYMADVKDALAVHIKTQKGTHILIDGGEDYKFAKYLHKIGVRDVIIINTHPHKDHYGGLIDIAKEFNVKAFFAPTLSGDKEYMELISYLENKNVPIREIRAGESLYVDKVSIRIAAPFIDATVKDNVSLNAYIEINGKKILITGDTDIKDEILYEKVDVLFASHHGSPNNTSDLMLKTTDPSITLVSGNRLIKDIERFKGQVFSTKDSGGVKLVFKDDIYVYEVAK